MTQELRDLIEKEIADIDPNSDTRTSYWDGRLDGLRWVLEQAGEVTKK